MGYNAYGEGFITLKKTTLTANGLLALCRQAFGAEAKIEDYVKVDGKKPIEILNKLVHAIDADYGYVEGPVEISVTKPGFPVFGLIHGDSYHDDQVKAFLDVFAPFAKEGNFELRGEDGQLWQFDFRNNSWAEDTGAVHYATGEPLKVEPTKKGLLATKDGEGILFSKGEIAKLVSQSGYSKDKDVNREASNLLRALGKCIVCDCESCFFNPRGVCLAPMMTGKKPAWDTDDGCLDYMWKGGYEE